MEHRSRTWQRMRAASGVVECPSYGSARASSSLWDRAGLWHRMVGALINDRVPVAVASPTVVKKWATGSGNAGKAAVASAITRLMPAMVLPAPDTAAALALAPIGAHHLGWGAFSQARMQALKKVPGPRKKAINALDQTRFPRNRRQVDQDLGRPGFFR